MKRSLISVPALAACVMLLPSSLEAAPPGILNHQGRIAVSGENYTGTGHFKFALVNAAGTTRYWSNNNSGSGGGQPTAAVQTAVSQGHYALGLGDTALTNMTAVPASVFSGNNDVRLRIWFSTNGTTFEQLTPDRRITSAGYALSAATVSDSDVARLSGNQTFTGTLTAAGFRAPGTSPLDLSVNGQRALRIQPATLGTDVPNLIGGSPLNTIDAASIGSVIGGGGHGEPNKVTGAVHTATIAGGANNTVSAHRATLGGGYGNLASGETSTVGGGSANVAGGDWSTVSGGEGNEATIVRATVGGGFSNAASNDSATVAGGYDNTASGDSSTVAGGWLNAAGGANATVGGGYNNKAPSDRATVAGGSDNSAEMDDATIGGGYDNTASGDSATVAGGWANVASGVAAAVGGGYGNTASGVDAMIPGGFANTASGNYSFAAGTRAKAVHFGAFVWADGQDVDFSSTNGNQFLIRATGNVGINKNNPATALDVAGTVTATAFNPSSDRNLKENFATVDPQEVLEKVTALPITRWNFTSDASVPHVGPMAQDFHAAFGLGPDDRHISTVDADGVALAAIQGLRAEKDRQIAALASENASLKQRLERLEKAVNAMESITASRP